MLGSFGLIMFMILSGVVHGFWIIFLMCLSEFGILSFQFSLLSTTYQTYRSYKMENDMYPEDYKLKMKIEEAKTIKGQLELVINKMEGKSGGLNDK